jgi:two-component system cell cycle sensor histidine kinase/response regulator CckA
MADKRHYLEAELYDLIQRDPAIFDFLQAGSLDGLWYWDLENPEQEWMNPAFWQLLGYAPSEKQHLSVEWQDLIFPEDLQLAIANFEAHCKDPAHPYDQLVRYRHRDGSTVWVRCRGIVIRDKDGKPLRMLGAHNDLTALKEAEQQLREHEEELEQANATLELRVAERTAELQVSRERFELVTKATQDAVWDLDLVNGHLWWSENYDLLFGPRPQDSAESWDWWTSHIDEDEREAVGQSLQDALDDPACEHWGMDYHLNAPSGKRYFVQDRAHISRDADGKAVRVVGSMRDQTPLEEALEERERIERKVFEAQKLESLGVLSGGIAHDFNNLLTAMLGNVSLAKAELPPGNDLLTYLNGMETAAVRAADLCKQLLAYSGKGRFVVGPLDLNELIEGMVSLLKISISKSAHLRFSLAPRLSAVRADATQLNQVIMNLVINASEAIGESEGTISLVTGLVDADADYLEEIALSTELAPGRFVYLEVADTGSGMDLETKAKIFDPFFSTKFTGRGLGLAAVQGIIRGHKGALKVYSEPGCGSTFKILLPAHGEVPAKPSKDEPATQYGSEGLVLIVEDEAVVRGIAEAILSHKGFDTITAIDGQDGVERFAEHRDEVVAVLLDLTMPRMGGVEAFRRMRQLRPDRPVVLMSGYNEQDAVQRFTGKGLAGFLQKPFTASSLAEAIHRAVHPA